MCTVSVYQNDTALMVTMNRDEARTRGQELPPTFHGNDIGPNWMAPLDSDTGGTWIGVNDRGVVACLLNRYQNYDKTILPENPRSRGAIVPMALGRGSVNEAQAWIVSEAFRPECFPPFTLLLLEPSNGTRLDWSGRGGLECSELDRPWAMVTSSFFQPEAVVPWRTDAFAAWRDGGAHLTNGIPAFHLLQPVGDESIAPLMVRDISCTRSITQIKLDTMGHEIAIHHGPVIDGKLAWPHFETHWELPRLFPTGDLTGEH